MIDVGDFTVFQTASGFSAGHGVYVRVADADDVRDMFLAHLSRDEAVKLAGALLASVAVDRAATVQDIVDYK